MKIYQRLTKQLEDEVVYQEKLIRRLYQSTWGKFLLPIVTHKWFSRLWTWRDHTSFSQNKIKRFVRQFGIDLTAYEAQTYVSFADFFTRKYKQNHLKVCSEHYVMAVAEGKLLTYVVSPSLKLEIKNQIYTLAELLQSSQWATYFNGGIVCIYRLSMSDYHRYLYAETGAIVDSRILEGRLHSIRSIAQERQQVFSENQREFCIIKNTNLGFVLQMEIGALTVGKIHNHPRVTAQRGLEKGWFGLGGSTIIVIYPANTVEIDADIQHYSGHNIETQVRLGERVGVKNV